MFSCGRRGCNTLLAVFPACFSSSILRSRSRRGCDADHTRPVTLGTTAPPGAPRETRRDQRPGGLTICRECRGGTQWETFMNNPFKLLAGFALGSVAIAGLACWLMTVRPARDELGTIPSVASEGSAPAKAPDQATSAAQKN